MHRQGHKASVLAGSLPGTPFPGSLTCCFPACRFLLASRHLAEVFADLSKAVTPFQVIVLCIPREDFSSQPLSLSRTCFFFLNFKTACLHLCIVCVHSPRLERNHHQIVVADLHSCLPPFWTATGRRRVPGKSMRKVCELQRGPLTARTGRSMATTS